MAVATSTVQGPPSGLTYIIDTALTKTDVLVSSSAVTLYQIKITNTGNATTAYYLQMWDAAAIANVALGTNKPDNIFYCAAATTQTYVIPAGQLFNAGIVMAGSTDLAAVTYTPPNPGVSVTVELLIK